MQGSISNHTINYSTAENLPTISENKLFAVDVLLCLQIGLAYAL